MSTSTEEHVGDTVSDDGTGDSATHGRRRLGEKAGLSLLLDVNGLRGGGSMLGGSMLGGSVLSGVSGGVSASGLRGGGVGGCRGTSRGSRLLRVASVFAGNLFAVIEREYAYGSGHVD